MNYLKITMLLATLTALLVLIGRLVGGTSGAVVFFGIAALMNFFAYWYSDVIVLRMYQAREINRDNQPQFYRIVERLAAETSMPVPKVYIIDEPNPNAFATGRNPHGQ